MIFDFDFFEFLFDGSGSNLHDFANHETLDKGAIKAEKVMML